MSSFYPAHVSQELLHAQRGTKFFGKTIHANGDSKDPGQQGTKFSNETPMQMGTTKKNIGV